MANFIEIYEILRTAGLCSSQREFSRDFLAKSAGYLAQMNATDAVPSLSVIASLVGVLHAMITDDARRPSDYVARRQLRSAWVASAVMLQGERERRQYPARRFPHPFETAAKEDV